MPALRDLTAYFCAHYPHKSELSKARVTKMVYLADWKSAIERGRQITEIDWIFHQFGPYVDDVVNSARNDRDFVVQQEWTIYGNRKETILYKGREPSVERGDRKIIDFVIEKTSPLNWDEFIKLVYSTYPIVVSPKGYHLDLPSIAERYGREREKNPKAVDSIG